MSLFSSNTRKSLTYFQNPPLYKTPFDFLPSLFTYKLEIYIYTCMNFGLFSFFSIMASNYSHLIPICFIILSSLFLKSYAETVPVAPTFKPNRLILLVYRDRVTRLFVTNIKKRTPLIQIPLLLDLNGQNLWVTCDQNYLSQTYQAPFCHSAQCIRADSPTCLVCGSGPIRPGCHNNSCGLVTVNPVTHQSGLGELAQDVVSVPISPFEPNNSSPLATVPNFLFACAPSSLLQNGLPNNVQGVVGLGHGPISLPGQLASYFGYPPRFALCLPPFNQNGVVFFGEPPYILQQPGNDVFRQLRFTPLTVSQQGEYYIGITSIRINNIPVPLNTTVLRNRPGLGGTRISTTTPYTVLEHGIYQSFTQFFVNQLRRVPRVEPVAPFEFCFDMRNLRGGRFGRGVPRIEFVLQNNENESWRIFRGSSMVRMRDGVSCLGFVNGGIRPRDSIVIGAHQLVNNLVQFDLAGSRLGFSRANCNFNFTTTPER